MKHLSNNPLISVIIISYNTKDITLTCLEKLKESINFFGKKVETVVVENGTDGTGKIIKQKYKWVKLLEPKSNTGFAKGQNIGINNASKNAKYFLLLNSDAYLNKETLKHVVSYMSEKGNCDVLGCKLTYEDGRLQPSAGYLPTPLSITSWSLGFDLIPGLNKILKPFHPNYSEFFLINRKVGWVTGAFMFMKSEVIKKTAGFDENYFMYGEEVEWCKRITSEGFSIWYTPDVEIVHLFAQSSEGTRTAFLKEVEGIYYYTKKYFPRKLGFVKAMVKTGMFLRALVFGLLGNSYRSKIHFDALKIK